MPADIMPSYAPANINAVPLSLAQADAMLRRERPSVAAGAKLLVAEIDIDLAIERTLAADMPSVQRGVILSFLHMARANVCEAQASLEVRS